MWLVKQDDEVLGYCARASGDEREYYFFPKETPDEPVRIKWEDTYLYSLCKKEIPLTKKHKKFLKRNGYTKAEIMSDTFPILTEKKTIEKTKSRKEKKDMYSWKSEKKTGFNTTKSYGGGYGYSWNSGPKGNQFAFRTKDGITFYGSKTGEVEPLLVDVVIPLIETYTPDKVKITGYGAFESLSCEYRNNNPNTLHLPVKDYQAPVYDLSLYEKVLDIIKEKGFKSVVIYCSGGKGRTGTVLAIFALLSKEVYDKDNNLVVLEHPDEVVSFIKKSYLEGAIETQTQRKYIENIWVKKYGEIKKVEEEKKEVVKENVATTEKNTNVASEEKKNYSWSSHSPSYGIVGSSWY